MSKILEMIEKRNQAWNAAKAFVEERRDQGRSALRSGREDLLRNGAEGQKLRC